MAMTHRGHPRRWMILGVLILALFAISLDNTILNIALPTLSREFNAGTSELQWMVDAYVLVFAGLLLVAGAISDRFGRKMTLVIGLWIFGAGSLAVLAVTNATELILLRGAMGVGAALAMPSTLSILADVFSDEERPKAIAAWSAVSAIGIVVGPTLGGFLLERFAWNSVFLVNLPFVVVGTGLTLLVVPESKAPGKIPLDPIGALISIGMLVTLVYGIIESPSTGIFDPLTGGSLAAALVLIAAFVWWERRVAHPMLDVRIFRNLRFTAASLSISLAYFALMGAIFFLSQYLQGVRELTAFQAGLRFIPIAIGVMVAAPISAQLTLRIGTRFVVAMGLSIVAIGLALLATLTIESTDLHFAGILLVIALGLGIAMTPATDAIMGALPKEKFGVGSAVNDTTREVGGALGVAILGSIFSAFYADGMSKVAALLPTPYAELVKKSFQGAVALAAQAGGANGAALLAIAKTSFLDGMHVAGLVGAGCALAAAGIALVFLPNRAPSRTPAAAEPAE